MDNSHATADELEQDAAAVEQKQQLREVIAYTYEDYVRACRARDGYFPRNEPLLDRADADPAFR